MEGTGKGNDADSLSSEDTQALEEWIYGKPGEKRRHDTCLEDVPGGAGKKYSAEEEVSFPPLYIDEFSTSSADTTSIFSIQSEQSFPTYRDFNPDDLAGISYRYEYMLQLIKFLRGADTTSTTCILTMMLSLDLRIDQYVYALEDSKSIQTLVNMLEIPIVNCQVLSLQILARITRIPYIQGLTLNIGLGKACCELIRHSQRDVVTWSLKILANLTKTTFGRSSVRKNKAIPYLVMYADSNRQALSVRFGKLTPATREPLMVALYCIRIIRNVTHSRKGREELYKAGLAPLLYFLLKCKDFIYVLNALYIIINCSRCDLYLGEFEVNNVHEVMIKMLQHHNETIALLAGFYLHKVCDEPKVLAKLLEANMLSEFFTKLKPKLAESNSRLYDTIILIMHKMSRTEAVMHLLRMDNQVMPQFCVLTDVPCDVDAEKALWQMISDITAYPDIWARFTKMEGMMDKILFNLTRHIYEHVRGSVARIVGHISHDERIFSVLQENEIVVKLWSLLCLSTPYTVFNACKALLPVLKRTDHFGQVVRAIANSFHTLKELLESDDPDILTGALLLLSKVLQDEENLIIIEEMDALKIPLQLMKTAVNPKVRASICYLIASIISHGSNNFQFGRDGHIPMVIKDLKSNDIELKIAAAHTLWKISEDPVNCVILFTHGAPEILFKCLLIYNKDLQIGAGGCLYNIRNLAFDSERKKWLFFNEPLPSDEERVVKKYKERATHYKLLGVEDVEPLPDPISRPVKKKKKKKLKKSLSQMSLSDLDFEEEIVIEPTKEEKQQLQKDLWAFWGLEVEPKICGDIPIASLRCFEK